jgi:NADP-dependent 3-hydroxy acid dehydrogenase YdfG
MEIFLTGSTGGIGLAIKSLLEFHGHNVTAPSKFEFDITDFESIDKMDLSRYDIVINSAGANQGAYLGWHNNSWQNQQYHVAANFTGPLFLAKQYTRQRSTGQFIYITSISANDPRSHTIFMIGSKGALRYSLNAVKRDHPGILFTEIVPSKTRTNMLQQNYQGTRSDQEIAAEYDAVPCLEPNQVADMVLMAMTHRLSRVDICPKIK